MAGKLSMTGHLGTSPKNAHVAALLAMTTGYASAWDSHSRRDGRYVQVPDQVGELGHVFVYHLLQRPQLLVYISG